MNRGKIVMEILTSSYKVAFINLICFLITHFIEQFLENIKKRKLQASPSPI